MSRKQRIDDLNAATDDGPRRVLQPACDWAEIERVADLPLEPGPCPHNTFVHICRALLETRRPR